jgi:hypothetical protein
MATAVVSTLDHHHWSGLAHAHQGQLVIRTVAGLGVLLCVCL